MDELILTITNFAKVDRPRGGKRERITWEKLRDRLASTKRTKETIAEYLALPGAKQTEIKDVGGFVGGTFKDNYRSKHTVEGRRLLTIDVDNGRLSGAWETVKLLEVEACMYTTHKHTHENHRYRIVILLSRTVDGSEYTAISKHIAELAGVEDFDDTTHQADREMFYPSTSIDGEFKHDISKGEALDVDTTLNEIRATGEAVGAITEAGNTKAEQDPAEKGGVIGAFCSVYSIGEAITEFIPEVYAPGSRDNKYTYTGGTTADGLVLYQKDGRDVWAHSFHQSDPAGGADAKSLNAFDLVRIHKFGDGAESLNKMLDFALRLPEVKALVDEEEREKALEDYEGMGEREGDPLALLLEQIEWEGDRKDMTGKKEKWIVKVIRQILKTAKANSWQMCAQKGFIYVYTGKYWKPVQTEEAKRFLSQAAVKMGAKDGEYHKNQVELLEQFLVSAYLPAPVRDEKTVLINVDNGTLEIVDGVPHLREHRAEDFITYVLPFCYNPDAKCALFDKYLLRVLPDESLRAVLCEFVGYIFTQSLKLETALILYGDGGNGKSVLFEVITRMLGKENVSTFGLDSLTDSTGYSRAQLVNKLLNFSSEISARMDSGIFKKLVSGEGVEARVLYQMPFEVENKAKLIFNCNELPNPKDQSYGIFRRLMPIPFNVRITDDEKDVDLHNKITENELSGVLNWALAGLARLLESRKFTRSKTVEDEINGYRLFLDNVRRFIQDNAYVPDKNKRIKLQELYGLYAIHCDDTGESKYKLTAAIFGKRLRNMGFEFTRIKGASWVYIKQETEADEYEERQ